MAFIAQQREMKVTLYGVQKLHHHIQLPHLIKQVSLHGSLGKSAFHNHLKSQKNVSYYLQLTQ